MAGRKDQTMLEGLRKALERFRTSTPNPQEQGRKRAPEPREEPRWVLTIRPPMNAGRAGRQLCEWGLTLLKDGDGRECNVESVWFLASLEKTLAAHETIERLGKSTHLNVAQVRTLVESHRARTQPVHVIRTIGNVRVEDSFETPNDPRFAEALTWNRPRERG